MAKQTINIGTNPNSLDGDKIRAAFTKVNSNFDELYTLVEDIEDVVLSSAVPSTSIGASGDVAGLVAFNNSYFYYCTAAYDGTTNIWRRIAWSGDTW